MDHESAVQEQIRAEIFGGARKAKAGFYWHAVKDEQESERLGHPVYTDVEYVLVVLSGGQEARSEDFSYRVTDEHRKAFPEAYAKFKELDGQRSTPLVILPDYMPSVGAALVDMGIRNIEALAAATVPAAFEPHRAWAKRYVAFRAGVKPRLRLVNGQLEEVAA